MDAAAVNHLNPQAASSPPPDFITADQNLPQQPSLRAGPAACQQQHAATPSDLMLQQQQHVLRQVSAAGAQHAVQQADSTSQQQHVVWQAGSASAQQHAVQQANLARHQSGLALGRMPAQRRASDSLPQPHPASIDVFGSSEVENRDMGKQIGRMQPAPVLWRVQSKFHGPCIIRLTPACAGASTCLTPMNRARIVV